MLFKSFPFLVLLAVTLPLYYLPLQGRGGRFLAGDPAAGRQRGFLRMENSVAPAVVSRFLHLQRVRRGAHTIPLGKRQQDRGEALARRRGGDEPGLSRVLQVCRHPYRPAARRLDSVSCPGLHPGDPPAHRNFLLHLSRAQPRHRRLPPPSQRGNPAPPRQAGPGAGEFAGRPAVLELPSLPDLDAPSTALIAEVSGILSRLQAKGSEILIVMLPPGSVDSSIPRAIAAKSRVRWWDLTKGLPPGSVGFSDGLHLDAPSAQKVMLTLTQLWTDRVE